MGDETEGPKRREYHCEACGGVFVSGWSDEEADDEAMIKGVNPDDAAIICDDCYKLTPYGADPEAN